MKFSKIIILFLLIMNGSAIATTQATSDTSTSETFEFIFPSLTILLEPSPVTDTFVPIEIIKYYRLKIDEEKSFFNIAQNDFVIDEQNINVPIRHSIAGEIILFEKHFEDAYSVIDQTRVNSINFESEFKEIDLSSLSFWAEGYNVNYQYVNKVPINYYCNCSVLWDIDFGAPTQSGSFDGATLNLSGSGTFKQDEADGIFRLHHFWNATHKINYHIEATVISSVPLPAAFYLFICALGGIMTMNRFNTASRSTSDFLSKRILMYKPPTTQNTRLVIYNN
jgi:hypothetical protein